jgi:hypothetical protein
MFQVCGIAPTLEVLVPTYGVAAIVNSALGV